MTPENGRDRQSACAVLYVVFISLATALVVSVSVAAGLALGLVGCALITLVDYAIAAYAFHLKGDR